MATFYVALFDESYDAQQVYFVSDARTGAGIVRAAERALAAKYRESFHGRVTLHDISQRMHKLWGKQPYELVHLDYAIWSKKRSAKRRYYAEWCPRGVNTMSEGDTLMVFQTEAERDEMVERLNAAEHYRPEGVARAILLKDAKSLYRIHDIGTEHEREVDGLRTSAGRPFFEVGCRKGGALR